MDHRQFLIGNAHIDPVWLWNKEEGLSEIKATFRSALDRMNEFPDYVFTAACASYYKWISENAPQLFEEIRMRAAEGRFCPAGGMWVQPDCNIPSGESFVRHLLYSIRFFKENVGIMPEFGYNVDSFGHNGMLPQLLNRAGISHYVFMRPSIKEKTSLPENLFLWESPDGSRVLTFRIHETYGANPDSDRIAESIRVMAEQDIPFMTFYGVGNHGGGPTIRQLQEIERQRNENVIYGSPADYFRYVDSLSLPSRLRVVKEDLQHHASGCYAANSTVKAANRKAENLLLSAERFDSLASFLLAVPTSREMLRDAWEDVLFNQFHDILAGCSIREAYDEALDAFGGAANAARKIRHAALQHISWNIDTRRGLSNEPAQRNGWNKLWEKEGEGAPLVVFNPHSFVADIPVQINAALFGITDADGTALPLQRIRGPQTNGENDKWNTLTKLTLPPFGYRTVFLFRDQTFSTPHISSAATLSNLVLDNGIIRVEFDRETGYIREIRDLKTGKQFNSNLSAVPIVIDDTTPDTWAHDIFTFDKVVGRFSQPEFRNLENGPIRAGIRITTHYGSSVLRQDFYLAAGSNALEIRVLLHFHEHLKLVKLSFPFARGQGKAVYSIPFGYITKETNGEEEPMQTWSAMLNSDGSALAVCNNGRYSCSMPDGEMRITLARACFYADHYAIRDDLMEYQDQGELKFSYNIIPQSHFDPAEITRCASLLNYDIPMVHETHHAGSLPVQYSGCTIHSNHCQMETVKSPECGNGWVVRLWETAGKDAGDVEIDCFGFRFRVNLNAYEFRTYKITPDGAVNEILLTEYEDA